MRAHDFAWPFLLLVGLAACGGDSTEEGSSRGVASAPDVVLILIDTLRADALSFYGNERETAPYLARLASEGTVFRHAHSVSSWTAPSTASLLTGVYPDRHGVTRGFVAQFKEGEPIEEQALPSMELLAISSDAPTLAERFKELGYQTYGISSNVNIGPEMEFQRGFDRFERHDTQAAKFLRQRLVEWRDEMDPDAPRFLYLHFNDVHHPYQKRPRFYRAEEGRDETAELRALYESELGYVDGFLARLQEDFGFDDDTLMVIAADHGEEFRDHGRLYHDFSLHVELNWIPLIVHAPGLRVRPGAVGGNVSLIDVAPTILDLIGLDVAEEFDGRSLAPMCWAEDKDSDLAETRGELSERPLFLHRFEGGEHLWGVVQGDWKLIRGDGGYLLYDRASDPREQKNLASEEWDVTQRLEGLLEGHKGRGARPKSVRTNVDIDADLLRRLRAAGYVSGDDDE